jgi:hypothetical protein
MDIVLQQYNEAATGAARKYREKYPNRRVSYHRPSIPRDFLLNAMRSWPATYSMQCADGRADPQGSHKTDFHQYQMSYSAYKYMRRI